MLNRHRNWVTNEECMRNGFSHAETKFGIEFARKLSVELNQIMLIDETLLIQVIASELD